MANTFQETIREVEQTIADAKKRAEAVLMQEFKDVFVRHPELKCITWVQYTPYFNDGDACTFRVNDVNISNYEEVSHWGEWDGDEEEPEDFEAYDITYGSGLPSKYKDLKELGAFMNSDVGEGILEFAFGDHVSVKVTPAGIETNDYEHD